VYSGATYIVVAGAGAGGGGSNEGTANDVNTPGGGSQPAGVNGTTLTATQGGDYGGEGGGGGGGGGGYYGGLGQTNLGSSGQASGGGNYIIPTAINTLTVNGSTGLSAGGGGTGGANVVIAWTGFGNVAGGGGNNSGNGYNGIVIIRYPGTQQKASGGNVTFAGGYTYHTFPSSGTYTFVP
jgi:hypothetical protein